MISRLLEDEHRGIGIIVDSNDIDEGKNPYCKSWYEFGILSILRERLYRDDNGKSIPPEPDNDNWLQCWYCGLIVAVREIKQSGTISGISGVEPVENPYDFNKKTIVGLDSKKERMRKLAMKKSKERKYADKDIQRYLNDGWELTNYSSSPPI